MDPRFLKCANASVCACLCVHVYVCKDNAYLHVRVYAYISLALHRKGLEEKIRNSNEHTQCPGFGV